MKIAFSKPTRDDAGQRELFDGFRAAGYAGLQLKGNQYGEFVADPPGFATRWGGDQALTSALITMGTLDETGAPTPVPCPRWAARRPPTASRCRCTTTTSSR